jgi:hypothetical protein
MREVVGSTTSISAMSIGWLAPINEVLETISFVVSIVAGLIVVVPWLIKRFKKK